MDNNIASTVIINWNDSIEHLNIDPSNFNNTKQISRSRLFWKASKTWGYLNITSAIKKHENGNTELTIIHDHNLNDHIDPDDTTWGMSSICFKPGETKGIVNWDDKTVPTNSGERNWEIRTVHLKENKEYENICRIKRIQSQFRSALLDEGESLCAISGESTVEALQAAHIISVKDQGPDDPVNGILLRADLHQLYDSNKFKIDPSGKIVDIDTATLSDEYIKLLSSKKLSPETLSRVRQCLKYKWKNIHKKRGCS